MGRTTRISTTAEPAPPRRGRPRGTAGDDTSATILRAARECFARGGFETASIKEIGAAAGVTAPTIYHHFGSKRALFAAVMRDAEAQVAVAFRNAIASRSGFGERLTALIDATKALNASDPTLAACLSIGQVESLRVTGLAEAALPQNSDLSMLLVRVVADAREHGELARDADPEAVIGLITALTFGMALYATLFEMHRYDSMLDECKRLFSGKLVLHEI